MLGSRPEGLYADRMRPLFHRGSIYALRMPQEPQRVFARYRSDIGYTEGLQQATAYRAANKGKALSHALRLGWQCTVLAATTYRVSRSATGATERFLSCRRSLYRADYKKPSEAILMRSAGYSDNFFGSGNGNGSGNGSGNGKYLIAFSHGSSVAFVML